MKSGTLALGIILLILGGLGFIKAQNVTSEYETAAGQLARGLSSEEQSKYETWMMIKYGAILFGITGLGATIYGAAAGSGEESSEKETEKVISEKIQGEDDQMEKLSKLNDLKENGAITEEEFEEKKKEILEKI